MSSLPVNIHSLPPKDDFRAVVVPAIAGVLTQRKRLDAGASQSVWSVRFVARNDGNDVAARNMLMSGGYSEVGRDGQGGEPSNADLLYLYLVGIGSATNTSGNVMLHSSTTTADWDAAIIKFTFDSADTVRDFLVQAFAEYAATGGVIDPRYLPVSVKGVSYAT